MFISSKAQPTDSISTIISRVKIATILSWMWNALLLLVCVVFLRSVLMEAFYIPSKSMAPTLDVSDYILVTKFSYGLHIPFKEEAIIQWGTPRRGEVVVFTRKEDPQTHFVKRVIGVAGDLIEIKGSDVIVNGFVRPEPYARWGHPSIETATYHYGPVVVPENSLFLLGDNRSDSKDSRFWSDPFVGLKNVVGKACLIYWSTKQLSRVGVTL